MSARRAAVSKITAPEFNLALTIGSGQAFHWMPQGTGYLGLIGDIPVHIEQSGGELVVTRGAEAAVRHYFALDHPLPEIYATFPSDPALQEALQFCRGVRILRQPAWECLATFITSSMKQVAHITQMSHAIRQRFGSAVPFACETLYAYPSPQSMAEGSEQDLRDCKLGYRAKNLLETARMIAEGTVNLLDIAKMDDDEARAELCRLPGVGEKVANCVLLFGYERLRSFPIDVWIERVLRERYFARKRNVTLKRLKDFCEEHFGPYGGYAQQYLFHHARTS
jgi:N-glycosylase/DNA lyase